MIIKPVFVFAVIVSLTDVKPVDFHTFNKQYYNTQEEGCQLPKYKNTMEYNYKTMQELIEEDIDKYQDVMP